MKKKGSKMEEQCKILKKKGGMEAGNGDRKK
jgi:hypothetical protein